MSKKNSKELIIFGRSPYISEIEHLIEELQNKYYTLGINYFPVAFPNVDFWFGIDPVVSLAFNEYKNKIKAKCITQQGCKHMLDEDIPNIEYFTPIRESIIVNKDKDSVGFCNYSSSSALNWAYLTGFTSVYLAGVDLNQDWKRFHEYGSAPVTQTLERITKERGYIKDMSKLINIYQLNPNSNMDIPKYNVQWLLI